MSAPAQKSSTQKLTPNFRKHLADHKAIAERRANSEESVAKLRARLAKEEGLVGRPLSIFAAGSLGRLDAGKKSDLDLFVLADTANDISRLLEFEIFSTLIQVNRELAFPSFSNDGQYLKIYDVDEMRRVTGTPRDDHENLFTARMLLLLESRPICNDHVYAEHLEKIGSNYFRDARGKSSFRPLFLLNDLLRYWRTLCLNYEEIRLKARPWRKKNVNLKFSRMLTVFATVLAIVSGLVSSSEALRELASLTPLERLASALDHMGVAQLMTEFERFLDNYETFLSIKDNAGTELILADPGIQGDIRRSAEAFSRFLYKTLTHPKIKPEYQRYLVI